jgi:hypothetical protein
MPPACSPPIAAPSASNRGGLVLLLVTWKESVMPLIKPRTRGKHFVRHITRLERENNETLHAYAQFLGESTDYVVNQVIDTVLGKDKEFLAWRDEHPQSVAPRPFARVRKRIGVRDAPHGNEAGEKSAPPPVAAN